MRREPPGADVAAALVVRYPVHIRHRWVVRVLLLAHDYGPAVLVLERELPGEFRETSRVNHGAMAAFALRVHVPGERHEALDAAEAVGDVRQALHAGIRASLNPFGKMESLRCAFSYQRGPAREARVRVRSNLLLFLLDSRLDPRGDEPRHLVVRGCPVVVLTSILLRAPLGLLLGDLFHSPALLLLLLLLLLALLCLLLGLLLLPLAKLLLPRAVQLRVRFLLLNRLLCRRLRRRVERHQGRVGDPGEGQRRRCRQVRPELLIFPQRAREVRGEDEVGLFPLLPPRVLLELFPVLLRDVAHLTTLLHLVPVRLDFAVVRGGLRRLVRL